MICPKCQAELHDGANFCNKCGAQITPAGNQVNTQPAAEEQSFVNKTAQMAQSFGSNAKQMFSGLSPAMRKQAVLSVIQIILLLICVIMQSNGLYIIQNGYGAAESVDLSLAEPLDNPFFSFLIIALYIVGMAVSAIPLFTKRPLKNSASVPMLAPWCGILFLIYGALKYQYSIMGIRIGLSFSGKGIFFIILSFVSIIVTLLWTIWGNKIRKSMGLSYSKSIAQRIMEKNKE